MQLLYLESFVTRGPVAQLGARFHGMEEVVGSNPTRSTKSNKTKAGLVSTPISASRQRHSCVGRSYPSSKSPPGKRAGPPTRKQSRGSNREPRLSPQLC